MDDIRAGLGREQVAEQLAATARKVVRAGAGLFEVIHDVVAPEDVPDKSSQPILALVALNAETIDIEAIITTTAPNRARLHQNHVFLLVPNVVHVKGEVWSEDRVIRMRDVHNRLDMVAREVMARRKLKARPESYGLTVAMLAEKEFEPSLKERELALETVVTQSYHAIWFPSAAGDIRQREIKTASGESGASVIDQIRRLLQGEGELITEEQAHTQENMISLSELFFDATEVVSLDCLRERFVCNRHWPVLERPALLDQIVREGVERGGWSLFRMDDAESRDPSEHYSRETDRMPLTLDLCAPGWSLVTPKGANQRGWGRPDIVDPEKVERWVADVIKETGPIYVKDLRDKVVEQHGEVPEDAVLDAVEKLQRSERLMTYSGEPEQQEMPANLSTSTHVVRPDDVIITPAVAVVRGWTGDLFPKFIVEGHKGAKMLLPILSKLGSFYSRGAVSHVKSLDLVELNVCGGGRLRLTLEDAPPEAMKRLGEFFETLATVVQGGEQTEAFLEMGETDEQCILLKALQQNGEV